MMTIKTVNKIIRTAAITTGLISGCSLAVASAAGANKIIDTIGDTIHSIGVGVKKGVQSLKNSKNNAPVEEAEDDFEDLDELDDPFEDFEDEEIPMSASMAAQGESQRFDPEAEEA